MPKLFLSQSVYLIRLLFLLGLRSILLLCLFSQPVQHNNSQSTDNFSSSCMQTRSHIHCTPFLLLPLPFFLCHTHKFRPPPNKSLVFPVSLTPNHSRSHSFETIVKQLKHSGSIKSHILFMGGGGWRLHKSYWQKAMNKTERMAESVQSRHNKTIAMCPNCRLIAMRILYYTSQPLINKYVNMVFNIHRNRKAYQGRGEWGKGGMDWAVGEEPWRGR